MFRLRYASTLALALFVLALPACDSGGVEDAVSIEGEWDSDQFTTPDGEAEISFTFDFETDGSDVSGSGVYDVTEPSTGEGGQGDLAVNGEYDADELDFTAEGEALDGDPISFDFDCDVQNETSMECDVVAGGQTFTSDLDFWK